MKIKNIFYCFLFLYLNSCIPYKSYQKTDTICDISHIKLQEYEMEFDKKLNPLEEEWLLVDSGNFIQSYIKYSKNNGFSITKKYKQDNLYKGIDYDYKGRIKSVVYTYLSTIISKSYFFDTLGTFTKVIDERKLDKYPICFREALEIVKKKTPKEYTIIGLERDSMTVNNKKIYHWLVATGDPKKYYWYYYYINAKTGKIIKKVRVQQGYD